MVSSINSLHQIFLKGLSGLGEKTEVLLSLAVMPLHGHQLPLPQWCEQVGAG